MFNKTFYEGLCELRLLYLKGYKKYPKNDYLDRPIQHHWDHIIVHLQKAKRTFEKYKNCNSRHKKKRADAIFQANLIHATLRLLMVFQIKVFS
jgi:hypothetical protein